MGIHRLCDRVRVCRSSVLGSMARKICSGFATFKPQRSAAAPHCWLRSGDLGAVSLHHWLRHTGYCLRGPRLCWDGSAIWWRLLARRCFELCVIEKLFPRRTAQPMQREVRPTECGEQQQQQPQSERKRGSRWRVDGVKSSWEHGSLYRVQSRCVVFGIDCQGWSRCFCYCC